MIKSVRFVPGRLQYLDGGLAGIQDTKNQRSAKRVLS